MHCTVSRAATPQVSFFGLLEKLRTCWLHQAPLHLLAQYQSLQLQRRVLTPGVCNLLLNKCCSLRLSSDPRWHHFQGWAAATCLIAHTDCTYWFNPLKLTSCCPVAKVRCSVAIFATHITPSQSCLILFDCNVHSKVEDG